MAANGNRAGESGEGGGRGDGDRGGDSGRGGGMRRGGRPRGAGLLRAPLQADSQGTVQFPLGLFLHPAHHRGLIFSFLQVMEVFSKQIFHIHDTEFLQYTYNIFVHPRSPHHHEVLF